MNKWIFFSFIFLLVILAACSTTKNIPEGQYLLNSITVKHDTRNATSDLEDFVRQQPNSSFKLRLMIYNAAGSDTTKWLTRSIRKLGQPPVIYSSKLAVASATQLQKQLVNQGYLNAQVDTVLKPKGVKMDVEYLIKGDIPYKVRDYKYQIKDTTMARIMGIVMDRFFVESRINKGDFYDMSLLEEERERVNSVMRNVGYATFSKDYVYFRADTTLNSHEVDLFLDIYPTRDSVPFPRYKMNNVTVVSGYNVTEMPDDTTRRAMRFFRNADTVVTHDLSIIRGRNKFLRNSTIYRNSYLKKGGYYSDLALTRTYESYSKITAIKQVNITTKVSPEDSTRLMDATIILTPANVHWFRASLDGTNSAGDIGIAPSISYQHQNLFNGGEKLSVRLKGAYEFIAGDKTGDVFNENFYEYGGEVGLTFPLFVVPWLKKSWRERPSASTQFSVGLTNQNRPEYNRQFFNTTIKYNWSTARNSIWHSLDLMDVNYVRMPWMSEDFRVNHLENSKNPLLKESYKDILIARTAYSGSITKGRRFNLLSTTSMLKYSVEVSGLLPRLATTIKGTANSDDGSKKILGVSYAEYVKGSVEYSQTFHFSKKHSIAYRVGAGIAQPYGNSNILPFERRFFGGGANGVRGWSTRSLGPGGFKNTEGTKNFVNQAGDASLIMSVEDRYKVTQMFELAAFIDAGNIWTLKDYAGQEGGQLSSDFYKEIAVAYGAGLRFDLSFLLLRLDVGIRAYDPSKSEGHRFVAPALPRMAVHFGIGYPF